MKRKIIACALILLSLVSALLPCGAVEAEPLTLVSAVLINDYQIVLTFSEPVVLNRNGDSTGPLAAVRLVGDNNELKRHENGQALQWAGILDYVDQTHDRLLFTVTATTLNVESLRDVVNFKGVLAEFQSAKVTFGLEEVKFRAGATDRFVENITTENGMVQLGANYYSGVDRLLVPLTVVLDDDFDLSARETIFRGRRDMDVTVGNAPKEGGE